MNMMVKSSNFDEYEPILHFPQVMNGKDKIENTNVLYETFRNCELNIPFLEAIKKFPDMLNFWRSYVPERGNKEWKNVKKYKW